MKWLHYPDSSKSSQTHLRIYVHAPKKLVAILQRSHFILYCAANDANFCLKYEILSTVFLKSVVLCFSVAVKWLIKNQILKFYLQFLKLQPHTRPLSVSKSNLLCFQIKLLLRPAAGNIFRLQTLLFRAWNSIFCSCVCSCLKTRPQLQLLEDSVLTQRQKLPRTLSAVF